MVRPAPCATTSKAAVFKELCSRAADQPDADFVVLIDEINRGNISRILGELLYLLEYRNQSVKLAYSAPNDAPFRIPENVLVLGTMNTTDRSLAQIDYALRRRFYFHRMMPLTDGAAPVLARWLEQTELASEQSAQVLKLFVALNSGCKPNSGSISRSGIAISWTLTSEATRRNSECGNTRSCRCSKSISTTGVIVPNCSLRSLVRHCSWNPSRRRQRKAPSEHSLRAHRVSERPPGIAARGHRFPAPRGIEPVLPLPSPLRRRRCRKSESIRPE